MILAPRSIVLLLVLAGCAGSAPREEDAEAPPAAPSAPTAHASADGEVPILRDLDETSTLADCFAHAALGSPRLRAAFETWKAALERIPQVGVLPDPRFTFGWYVQSIETRVGPQNRRYGLAQTFPWFGKLDLREDVAGREAEAARLRYEQVRLDLWRDVETRWLDLYELERSIEIVRENVRLIEIWEGVVRARYAAATAGNPDLMRIQVEQGKQEDRLRGLVDRREPLAARLNAVLGRPVGSPVPRPEIISEREDLPEADVLRSRLAVRSPELLALAEEAAKEEQAALLAGKDIWPDVTFGLEYIETGEARMPDVSDSGKDAVVALVSVNLPLWREKVRASVREAEHRRRAVLERRADVRTRLESELEIALFEVRESERRLDLYRDTLIPKSRQWLETASTSYQAGRTELTDVLDAWKSLLEFRLSLERALVRRERARAEIVRIAGGEEVVP